MLLSFDGKTRSQSCFIWDAMILRLYVVIIACADLDTVAAANSLF